MFFHCFAHTVIVRKIPADDRLSVCLWIREKEGKLKYLPTGGKIQNRGLLGNDYTFGKTERFCEILA